MDLSQPSAHEALAGASSGAPLVPQGAPARLLVSCWERRLGQTPIHELESTSQSLTPEQLAAWFELEAGVRELGLVATCQRIVVLAVTEGPAPAAWLDRRLASLGAWDPFADEAATRRVFRIAAGLDSLATGEREIRDQVRSASGEVLSRHPRPILRRLLLDAADSAARASVADPTSVADVAADWLVTRLPGTGARVVLLGGGRIGRRLAERLAARARVTVVVHRQPPDPEWLRRWGLRSAPGSELRRELEGAYAVVSAARASERLLGPDDLPPPGASRPRVFVDLGMPRNIDPAVGDGPEAELLDLSCLPAAELSAGERGRLEEQIRDDAEATASALARACVEPWVSSLRQLGEALRRSEFEQAVEFAGPLSEAARRAFERMSERLAGRLLARPTAELRSLPPGPEHDARRREVLDRFRDPDVP